MLSRRSRGFYVALLWISIAGSVTSLAALAVRPEETGRLRTLLLVSSLLLVIFVASRLSPEGGGDVTAEETPSEADRDPKRRDAAQ